MNRGSEWHKWDLHFHTPSSYDYEDRSVTNDDIINGLLANDVAAVAITDHHVIDIARITELQRIAAGRISNICLCARTRIRGLSFIAYKENF